MEQNLINDIFKLFSLDDNKIIEKIIDAAVLCINDYILEASIKDEDLIAIDIGIGTLNIAHVDNEIQYYFEPSKKLEKSNISTYKNNQNSLEMVLTDSIVSKMAHAYKELF